LLKVLKRKAKALGLKTKGQESYMGISGSGVRAVAEACQIQEESLW